MTPIIKFTTFYEAEQYHQDYYKNNPVRYKTYRYFSGRDRFVEKTWGDAADVKDSDTAKSDREPFTKPDDETLRKTLTPLQYKVTQHEGTENPFDNEFWNNHREGIYVDIVSGEPLFSSTDKFNSGTGWPSFTRPLVEEISWKRMIGACLRYAPKSAVGRLIHIWGMCSTMVRPRPA